MVEEKAESNTTAPLVLPVELLDQIAPYLGCNDVCNVRLPQQLFIKSSDSPKVRPFLPTPGPLAGFVKHLHIELDYFELGCLPQTERDSLISSIQKETTRFVALECLTTTWITSLPISMSLETLISLSAVEEGIMAAVADPALLRHLEMGPFVFPQEKHSLSLQQFVSLKSFVVNEIIQKDHLQSSVIQQTTNLLTHNHTLTSLELRTASTCSETSLHDLFPSRSARAELSLESLTFEGNFSWSPNFPFTSLPYFPNLRQLTILGNKTAKWDGLWNAFRQTNVRLYKLSVDLMVTHSLVDYLASFKGLRILELLRETASGIEFDVAERIISGVLPNHAPTLERLFIHIPCIGIHPDPSSEGSSFTSFWPSPSLFLHLQRIFTLSPRGLPLAHGTFQSMLNWLEDFPSLHHSIMITPSYWQEDTPPTLDGTGFTEIGGMLEGRTGRPAIWTVLHARYALAESGSWVAESSDEEGRWRYVPVPQDYNMEWPQWRT